MTVPTDNAVGIAVRDLFRTNLTDPLGRASNNSWIHYGDIQKHAKTPQVFVQPARGMRKFRRLGSGRQDKTLFFNCVVIVRISPMISTDLNEILDDVVNEMENTVEDNWSSLTGVWEMKVDNISGVFPVPDRKEYNNVVTIACIIENEGTRQSIY